MKFHGIMVSDAMARIPYQEPSLSIVTQPSILCLNSLVLSVSVPVSFGLHKKIAVS